MNIEETMNQQLDAVNLDISDAELHSAIRALNSFSKLNIVGQHLLSEQIISSELLDFMSEITLGSPLGMYAFSDSLIHSRYVRTFGADAKLGAITFFTPHMITSIFLNIKHFINKKCDPSLLAKYTQDF